MIKKLIGFLLVAGCLLGCPSEARTSISRESTPKLEQKVEQRLKQRRLEQRLEDEDEDKWERTSVSSSPGSITINLPFKSGYNKFYSTIDIDVLGQIKGKSLGQAISEDLVSYEEVARDLQDERMILFSDIHCSRKSRAENMKILEGLDGENFYVGIERITVKAAENNLRRFFEREINVQEFVDSSHLSRKEKQIVRGFGYSRLLKFLRDKGFKPLLLDESFGDFYERDLGYAKNVVEAYNEGKNVILIVGSDHNELHHVPYFIWRETGGENGGVFPKIVAQNSRAKYDILIKDRGKDILYEALRSFGFKDGMALKIKKGLFYYLNVRIKRQNVLRYGKISRKIKEMYFGGRKDKEGTERK